MTDSGTVDSGERGAERLLAFRQVAPTSEDARALVDRLSAELAARYGDDGGAYYTPEQAEQEGAIFIIASIAGRDVGCGALRALDSGVGEVKRMYVAPEARGGGVGGMILTELERVAMELGFHTLKLETGTAQPEAMRIYERAGYEQITPYGYYRADPRSRCYRKVLVAPAPTTAQADEATTAG